MSRAASPSLTYGEIKQRVAERAMLIKQDPTLGNIAMTAEPAAGKIRRAVDDGAREFLRARRWAFLTAFCQLVLSTDGLTGAGAARCIDRDPTRYLLPEYVESLPMAGMMWKGPEQTPGMRVLGHHYDEVVAMSFMDPSGTGPPSMWGAEFNPTLRSGQQSGGVELRIWPIPDRQYTVGFRARLGYVPFSNDNQAPQWPAAHDLTAVAFMVKALLRIDRDPGDPEQAAAIRRADEEAGIALGLSETIDNEDFRPGQIGPASADVGLIGRPMRGYDMVSNTLLVSTTAYDW